MLDGVAFEEAVISQLFNRGNGGGNKTRLETACLIDFCIRHGGVTWQNAKRLCPEGGMFKALGLTQVTQRCSLCRCPGHNKNHCKKEFMILAKHDGLI